MINCRWSVMCSGGHICNRDLQIKHQWLFWQYHWTLRWGPNSYQKKVLDTDLLEWKVPASNQFKSDRSLWLQWKREDWDHAENAIEQKLNDIYKQEDISIWLYGTLYGMVAVVVTLWELIWNSVWSKADWRQSYCPTNPKFRLQACRHGMNWLIRSHQKLRGRHGRYT